MDSSFFVSSFMVCHLAMLQTLTTSLGNVYTEHKPQCCDEDSQNNTVAPESCCDPFWGDSIVFNDSNIASMIAALLQH